MLKYLQEELEPGKIWMLLGARRVGKTLLIQEFLKGTKERWYSGQGEDATISGLLTSRSAERYRLTFSAYDGVYIDEAQMIPDIGVALKLLVDSMPHLKVIVTGSSAFHLGQSLGQPLTGRRKVRYLHSVSSEEIRSWKGPLAVTGLLEDLLIYGSYPEVLTIGDPHKRREYLQQLVKDYLLQDILMFERLRNARKMYELLTLVAWQVGSELSLAELAVSLQLNRSTVERYLDLLEKNFVLYRVGGFSRNLRKEVTKSSKFYFEDLGIRNALTGLFQPLALRPDKGALWENFVLNERRKRIAYHKMERTGYFWRTYDQQEIDWIEVATDGSMEGYECKWQEQKYSPPIAWTKEYPSSPVHLVHSENLDLYV